MKTPDLYRVTTGKLASKHGTGPNGAFLIPKRGKHAKNIVYICIASNGLGWEHVSVHVGKKSNRGGRVHQLDRTPTWEEMCDVKNAFWEETETVVQYHPAKKDYVNTHEYVLHLWKPINKQLTSPENILV